MPCATVQGTSLHDSIPKFMRQYCVVFNDDMK